VSTILNKSDSANGTITVLDESINTNTTSLSFLGKNFKQGYTQPIGENFLHLLENFAFSNPPINPVQGQLWFNNNSDVESDSVSDNSRDSYGLKIYDGTTWVPIGIIKKFTENPSLTSGGTNLRTGDLYVDTERQQLYINNGIKGWTLVGPTFNSAEKTGAEIEYIDDANSAIKRPVLSIFVKTKRVAVFSDYEFTPKSLISGFRTIRQGINLSTANLQNSTSETKFWGVAEKAEALIAGDEIVSTSNFLRSDQDSTTNFSFNVRNNNGINIGNDLSFSLGTDTSGSYLYNKLEGASIDFRLRQSTQIKTILRVATTPNNTGAIGVNNLIPEESLDVVGNIKTTDRFISTSTAANSITTAGGLNVSLNGVIGGALTVSGVTTTNNIEPSTDSTKTLGSENKRWDTIYAVKIGSNTRKVNLFGTLNGDVNGDVSGYSGGFKDTVTLSLIGDLEATITIKDDGESKDIVTALRSDLISQKSETSLYQPNDVLLLERNQQLYKVKKSTIAASLPLVPTGTILLFAGDTSNIPNGYLVCDGQEQSQTQYNALFSVIGYTYKPYEELIGPPLGQLTFAMPNLTSYVPNNNMKYIIYTGKIV
jgi:hypothetical protein